MAFECFGGETIGYSKYSCKCGVMSVTLGKLTKWGSPKEQKGTPSCFSYTFNCKNKSNYYFDRSYFSRSLCKYTGDRSWLSKAFFLNNDVGWPPYFLHHFFISNELSSYSKAEIFIKAKRRCKSIVLYLMKQRKWCKRKQLCSSSLLSHTDKPRIF